MQPTAHTLPRTERSMPDGRSESPTPTAAERPGPAWVESAELLKGDKAVGILHNGSLYRLQATRLGKLILTK